MGGCWFGCFFFGLFVWMFFLFGWMVSILLCMFGCSFYFVRVKWTPEENPRSKTLAFLHPLDFRPRTFLRHLKKGPQLCQTKLHLLGMWLKGDGLKEPPRTLDGIKDGKSLVQHSLGWRDESVVHLVLPRNWTGRTIFYVANWSSVGALDPL